MGGVTVFGLPAGPADLGRRPGHGRASGSCSVAARARGRSSRRRRSCGRCPGSRSSTAWPTSRLLPHDGPAGAPPPRRGRRSADLPRSPGRPCRRGDGRLPDPARLTPSTSTGRRSVPIRRTSPARSWRTTRSSATSSAGWTTASRQVGYWIGRDHWGKGYRRRQPCGFCSKRSTTGPSSPTSRSHNIGSRRVVEHCGFVGVGEEVADDGVARNDLPPRLAGSRAPNGLPPVSLRLVTDPPADPSETARQPPDHAAPCRTRTPTRPRRAARARPAPSSTAATTSRRNAARVSAASGSSSSSWSSSSS